jgi:hypothetical protein
MEINRLPPCVIARPKSPPISIELVAEDETIFLPIVPSPRENGIGSVVVD